MHTFRPSARKQRLLDHKFEANLVYRGRSRTARTIQRNKTKKVTSEYPGGKRRTSYTISLPPFLTWTGLMPRGPMLCSFTGAKLCILVIAEWINVYTVEKPWVRADWKGQSVYRGYVLDTPLSPDLEFSLPQSCTPLTCHISLCKQDCLLLSPLLSFSFCKLHPSEELDLSHAPGGKQCRLL